MPVTHVGSASLGVTGPGRRAMFVWGWGLTATIKAPLSVEEVVRRILILPRV